MSESPERYALGIDVGGTHTDLELVCLADGRAWRHKLASTPDDPARAVAEGTRELLALSGIAPGRVAHFAHGTTVGTNAVVQHRTARTALVTTAGFRDVLEIRRQRQPHPYNLRVDKPSPPIARRDRYEIDERRFLFGRDDVKPVESQIVELAERLASAGIEAVAVCLLHSYDDPAHERAVGAWLRGHLPGVFISLSCDVVPEPREYERTSTTAINACLGPVMSDYLGRIEVGAQANGLRVEPMILQSNGGVASVRDAARLPVNTLASGPAAGVIGAVAVAARRGYEDLITFDVGGTTADVCLVEGGAPLVATEREIAGYPVRSPTIDVHSVGAGGGSIASVDAGGFLHVGPSSAGADPGPAAYARGGTEPTVTDACLVLGHLNPAGLLAGRLALDLERARDAIERRVAEPLGMSIEDAAIGMLTLLNENMVQAVRVASIERGFDPRRFTLVAFGGAGPLLAGPLARALSIESVLIPPSPGLLCAQGLLVADERTDFSVSRRLLVDVERAGELATLFAELAERSDRWFDNARVPIADRSTAFTADMRYVGQSHELRVAAERKDGVIDAAALAERFHAEHRRNYGFAADAAVEAVTCRAVALARTFTVRDTVAARTETESTVPTVRRARFIGAEHAVECRVHLRSSLVAGQRIEGPAIIEQMDATTVVAGDEAVDVLADGTLLVSR